MSLRPVRVAFRCIKALGSMECMSPRTWPISWAATWTRSVSQTPATETAQLGVCCIHYFTHEILKVSANTIKMRAFLPAEAHVSQNPIFVVVKVDLACWREERVSQFSCDAIETMVQVGLPTVCVVDWIEACQNRETERNSSEPRRESFIPAPWRLKWGDDGSQTTNSEDDDHSSHSLWEFMQDSRLHPKGADKGEFRNFCHELICLEVVRHFFSLRIMKRVEYKLGNIFAVLRFNEAKKLRRRQQGETEKSGTQN